MSDIKPTIGYSCDTVDVTSINRPDPAWRHVDSAGHEHQWAPAGPYDPRQSYTLPTLEWTSAGTYIDPDDGEELDTGEYQCRQCREVVKPATTADTTRQCIPGRMRFDVDGRPVTPHELYAVLVEHYPDQAEAFKAKWLITDHVEPPVL